MKQCQQTEKAGKSIPAISGNMNNIAEALKPLAVPVNSVRPDPRNARAHDERNINTISKSLEIYGQRKPVICNSKTKIIQAGNGLWTAAKELNWDKIAVVFVDDNEEIARAYSLMDNQSGLLSEWDLPVLKDTLELLDNGAFDMSETGFTSEEIEDLMTQYFAPVSIDDLLDELDMSKAVDKPIWVVVRTEAEKQEIVERTMAVLEQAGLRVERSYEV